MAANASRSSVLFRRLAVGGGLVAATGGTALVYAWWSTPVARLEAASQPHGKVPPTFPPIKSRAEQIRALKHDTFDVLVIGGGATGSGCALDAASRGLRVAMVERDDFASGTSSRSTKLVHGGVRYLEKAVKQLDYGQYKLVKEALRERKTFLHIAPHLSFPLPIMLPIYHWWQAPYFWAGTKLYDILAGGENMESSYFLTKGKALEAFPMLKKDNLVGALVYYDGMHNDARFNVCLTMTAVLHNATVANHTEVIKIIKRDGKCSGALLRDNLTGEVWDVAAKGIINATGPFTDAIRLLDDPEAKKVVAPSSGVHIVLPGYYSPRKMGLIDPATSDGRVIFFLPWQGNTIAGTTDSPTVVAQNPLPKEEEIDWILGEVRGYLDEAINVRRGDVLAAWAGIRPLVKDPKATNTESLVRNHLIDISASGMVTIAGGKWTTYRQMAEEAVDAAISEFGLDAGPCVTRQTRLIGAEGYSKNLFIRLVQFYGIETEVAQHLVDSYGDRAWLVASMGKQTGKRWPVRAERLISHYPFIDGEVLYSMRCEYAQNVVDVIARRTRLAFLNSQAALECLPKIIDLMSAELGWSKKRQAEEWSNTIQFLLTMGLPAAKKDVTRRDVESGAAAKFETKEDYRLFSRHDGPDGIN